VTTSTQDQASQARAAHRLLQPRLLAAAGLLLLVAGFMIFMGIITAEALYPEGYSTSRNLISDLGASKPPNSIVMQPSARIFNSVMIASGILVIAAGGCLAGGARRWPAAVLTGFTGLGILGVGVFPADQGHLHSVFAVLIFAAGGLAAIVSQTVQRPPFTVVSILLGAISLAALVLYLVLDDHSPIAGLGAGGGERWIAYPILVWVMSFGGYLMGRAR
jgi:hypothetical membrane protein